MRMPTFDTYFCLVGRLASGRPFALPNTLLDRAILSHLPRRAATCAAAAYYTEKMGRTVYPEEVSIAYRVQILSCDKAR